MLNETKISDRPVDKFMRDRLQLCFVMYDTGVNNIQDAIQKLELNDYFNRIIANEASLNDTVTCEDGFSQSPLKKMVDRSRLSDRIVNGQPIIAYNLMDSRLKNR
ncbi:hypothetical protein Dsin_032479 [Dipteronia sinensis]|uniref:Uncharacterized protein n=1 Tax=Dipteronia sinensis TaxID=43782 RepID=A0AAE0DT80_9ROSI|nr:hypothetical protein Dsin_032479 [Dipteronia sinensis]